MAVEIATAYVSIVPTTRGIGRGIERELGAAGTAGGVSASKGFASGFLGATATKAIGFTSGLGIGAGILAGINVAADFEQTRIAFEGILGDKGAAAALIQELRDLANVTPFQFADLTKSAQQLLAVDTAAEDIVPTMTILGNQAAALGLGAPEIEGVVRALGQMKGKGKASAEELRQISEQFPGFSAIDAIAKKLGVTTSEAFKLMERGAVDADTGIAAILEGMENFPGAAGAMERQSKTLNGVLSTFKDTVTTAAIDFITPYLPQISAGIQAFSGWLQDDGIPAIQKFVDFIREAVEWVKQHWPEIVAAVKPTIETIREVLAGFVDVATTLWNNFGDNLLELVERVWPRIQQIIDGALQVIRGIVKIVTGLIHGDWSQVWDGIKGVVAGAWDAIQGIVGGALELLRTTVGVGLEILGSIVKDVGETLWDGLLFGLDAVVSGIAETMEWLLNEVIIRFINGAIRAYDALPFVSADTIDPVDFDIGLLPSQKTGSGVTKPTFGKYAGKFATGGVIPGTRGQPVMIQAHSGETVWPTHDRTWMRNVSAAAKYATSTSGEHITLQVVQYPGEDQVSAGMRALRWHQTQKTALAAR